MARTAKEEWRAAWPIPLIGLVGMIGSSLLTVFSMITYALVVHLVPILRSNEIDASVAAAVLGLMGISAVGARLSPLAGYSSRLGSTNGV